MKKGVVSTSKEGLVRNDEERTSVLQKASIGVDWDRIHNQSLQSMHCEQNDKWKSDDFVMACR